MSIFDRLGRSRIEKNQENEQAPPQESELSQARAAAREKVQGLIRESRYQTYVSSGMTPGQAAQVMGIRLKPGDEYNPAKIMQKVKGIKKI
jgi:hypothetical protein